MGGIDQGNDSYSTAISNSFEADAKWITGGRKKILLQEEKVGGAAYRENSSVIEQLIL
jgi:hypothetical protein